MWLESELGKMDVQGFRKENIIQNFTLFTNSNLQNIDLFFFFNPMRATYFYFERN